MAEQLKPHIKGNTYNGMQINLIISERDGVILDPVEVIDITGAIITATFRFGSQQGVIKNTYTIGHGITVIDAAQGQFTILEDTIIDWPVGFYYFDVLIEFPNGDKKTYVQGVLQIVLEAEESAECCDYKIIYCECPYAVVPCDKFIMRQNYNNQKISFYICVKTGNWGDQAILDLTNYDITVNLLDTTDSLYLSKLADWSSVTKKCTLSFDSFDLKDKGNYYVELDIQHKTEDLGWQIPDRHKRIDLEIK